MSSHIHEVPIRDTMIRLGQFIKLAGAVESGSMAKEAIAEGIIAVNGQVCTARGKQLHDGDVVTVGPEMTVSGQPERYKVATMHT